jgi:hypothetical protein
MRPDIESGTMARDAHLCQEPVSLRAVEAIEQVSLAQLHQLALDALGCSQAAASQSQWPAGLHVPCGREEVNV